MKIAILSDFHIGYERFAEDAFTQAEEALNKASSMSDALIIPGDIFDSRDPNPETLAQGINLFRNLSKREWTARVTDYQGSKKIYTNIPVVAIPGTHERRAQDAEDPVELLNLAGLLVNASDSRVVVEKGKERIAIFGLGGLSEERVRDALEKLAPKPMEGILNIFMLHQSIYELLPFSKDYIKFEDLPKGFDLYVNGHIHNRVEKKVYGKPFLIPGSTVLTQLKESEQEQKGFYLFDTSTKNYEFIAINSRNFFVERVDVTGKGPDQIRKSAAESVEKILKRSKSRPVIRIILTGDVKEGYRNTDIDMMELMKQFEGQAFVEITKSEMKDKASEIEIESLRKGEFGNMPVKDYGLSVFLEKLRASKYNLSLSPSELFEVLSSEKSKDKVLKEAIEKILAGK